MVIVPWKWICLYLVSVKGYHVTSWMLMQRFFFFFFEIFFILFFKFYFIFTLQYCISFAKY